MGQTKKAFRWTSPLGLLLLVVARNIISGDDDEDDVRPARFIVIADTLNIRSQPSTAAPIIGYAQGGMVVTATHQSGEWYGFEMTNGDTGWAHEGFLEAR